MLTVNLNAINWSNIEGPGQIDLHVPSELTGLQESVAGTLDISNQGYVYSLSSTPVLWLKFLGLTTLLSLTGSAIKCKHVAMKIFGKPVDANDAHELKHIFHLATIAGDAVIGRGRMSIKERVEQFALAEIDFNNSDRDAEMNLPRSIRLIKGSYNAKCMQPLFHQNQAKQPALLIEAIDNLKTRKLVLQNELIVRATAFSFFDFFAPLERSLSESQIKANIEKIDQQLAKKEKQLDAAKRCNKYAALAILHQQGCLTQALKDVAVETQAEVECCDIMCYKQQRICGLLYKIDCCAMRCWAIDCLCCVCCIWPQGRSVSIIT